MKSSKTSKVIPPPKGSRMSDADRRKAIRQISHKRLRAVLTAKDEATPLEAPVQGNLIDISLNGFGMCSSAAIPAGFDVSIAITTPKEDYKFIGKIVWSAELPLSGHVIKDPADQEMSWQLGVALDLTTEEHQKSIQALYNSACE